MNRTIMNVGLLAILPLALVALSPNLIGDANAINVGSQDVIGRPGYQPDKVCGDQLCSEVANSAKNGQKQSSSTSTSEYDSLSIQYAEKTQELSIANAKGDINRVSELQDELKDLRNQLLEWKNN